MHRLKLHKALSLTYFKPRSFAILGPTTFKVTNPYTQETLCEYTYKTETEINTIVHEAYDGYKQWRNVPLDERIKVVQKAGEYFSKKP